MNPQYHHLADGQRIMQAVIAGIAVFILCLICAFFFKLLRSGVNKAKKINTEAFVVKEDKSSDAVNNKRKSTVLQDWYNNITPWQRYFLWILSLLLVVVYGIGLIPLALLIYLKLGNQR